MNRFFLTFVFTVIAIACNSDDETKIDNSDLIGKWNWISTNGGIADHINETPSTMAKTIVLNLKTDFSYSIIENEIEVSSGTYELAMVASIYAIEMERFISFSNNQKLSGVVISGIIKTYDTTNLSISDNNYDGIGSRFKKVE